MNSKTGVNFQVMLKQNHAKMNGIKEPPVLQKSVINLMMA